MKKLILLLSLICVVAVSYAQVPATCCPNCPLFLPDGASAEFPIGVADNGDGDGDSNDDCTAMVLESIAISFDHEYIGDLSLIVTSPCGNTITLIGPVGFFGATDNTTWDITFVDGTPAPDAGFSGVFNNGDAWGTGGMYTGSYNPNMGNIADLNCPDNCGTWTFFVSDDQGIDVGNFLDFNLNFGQPTMDGEIACTSEPCAIDAVEITNIVCDDNGTPSMSSDDVYTFDLTATATQGSTFSDNQGGTGLAYDTPISYGPFPISGGDVTIDIVDDGDVACIGSATAVAPPPCFTPGTAEAAITAVCRCFGDQNIDTNNSGEADIFFEEITVTTTPAQPGITDWAFGPGTTGVFYDMTGAVITTPDSVVDNGDGTYTIGVYVGSGQFYSADFVSTAANEGAGMTTGTVSGGGCEYCDDIPTVGEWGLIILCLSMFITAIVGIRQRQTILAEERA